MKAKIAKVAKAGFESGMKICHKMRAWPAPIDFSSINQLFRDCHEELPQEKDEEGPAEPGRHHQREVSVGPTEALEKHILRYDKRFGGQEHGGQDESKEKILAASFQTREGVCRQCAGHQIADDIVDGDFQRIPGAGSEVDVTVAVPAIGRSSPIAGFPGSGAGGKAKT